MRLCWDGDHAYIPTYLDHGNEEQDTLFTVLGAIAIVRSQKLHCHKNYEQPQTGGSSSPKYCGGSKVSWPRDLDLALP
jgi:hypothetical protein